MRTRNVFYFIYIIIINEQTKINANYTKLNFMTSLNWFSEGQFVNIKKFHRNYAKTNFITKPIKIETLKF